METELGYQYLNTSFTGTKTTSFSGNDYFPTLPSDMGVSNTLANTEFKSFFPDCD